MESYQEASNSGQGFENDEYAKGSSQVENFARKKYEDRKKSVRIEREKRARKFNAQNKPPRFRNDGGLEHESFRIEEVLNRFVSTKQNNNGNMERFSEYFVKVSAFGASLATCTTTSQFVTSALQFLASIASEEIVHFMTLKAPASVEASSDALQKVLGFVRNFRGSYAELTDTPLYQFLVDIVGIGAICGYVSNLRVGECEILSTQWMQSCKRETMNNFTSVVLRSVEFTLEVVSSLSCGVSLNRFVSGRGVMSQVSTVLARESDIRKCLLQEKHQLTISQHLSQARSALVRLRELITSSTGTLHSVACMQRVKLEMHISQVEHNEKLSGFRKRPFAYLLAGDSAVGKSTLQHELWNLLGQAGGFETEPINIAEIAETDRYDSTITGASHIYQIDDMCQSKDLTKLHETPHERVIRYNNTAPNMAIKADVDDKGCIPIRPRVLAITTNVPHLQAASYMSCPEALLQNRINVAVKVSPKDYCVGLNGKLDPTKVREGESPHMIQEITYKFTGNKVTTIYGEKLCYDEWLPKFLRKFVEHEKEQEELEKRTRASSALILCHQCLNKEANCNCTTEEFKTEGAIVKLLNYVGIGLEGRHRTRGVAMLDLLNSVSIVTAREGLLNATNETFANIITYWFWRLVTATRWTGLLFLSFLVPQVVFVASVGSSFAMVYIVGIIYLLHLVLAKTRRVLSSMVVDEMVKLRTDFSNSMGAAIFGSMVDRLVIVGALMPVVCMLRMVMRSVSFTTEGQIISTTSCNIRERREEKDEWLEKPRVIPIQASVTVNSMTQEQAVKAIMRRVCRVSAPGVDGTRRFVRAINVYSNWVVIPKHVFKLLDLNRAWDFQFDDNLFGANRTSLVDARTVRDIRKDHVAVQVIKLNRNGDIRKYFPQEEFVRGQVTGAIALVEGKESKEVDLPVAVYKQRMYTDAAVIAGFEAHSTGITTAEGDCGTPWIRKGAPHLILGLHNGRHETAHVCETIYAGDFDFMEEVSEYVTEGKTIIQTTTPPVVEIETSPYGGDLLTGPDLHEKSCVSYCTLHPTRGVPLVEAYGSMKHMYSNSRSNVQRTQLSLALENHGQKCLWGKPPMHVARNHEEVFKIAQHPIDSIHPETLAWAQADYLTNIVDDIKRLKYTTKPLTEFEVFNGRKMENINPMNMDTSAGIGLVGKKKNHCLETVTDCGKKLYTPRKYVSDEIKRLRNLAISGKRCCPITKTALKDEPTKLTKDVARIFYVMPMAFIALCREVMCPVLAYMMATPIVCESWFGIRVTTHEWSQCYDHLNKFHNGKAINGDYSKYDLHFSAQLISSVGNCFATIAHHLGYPHSAVVMISSIFADLSNPLYSFMGTLVSFLGLMPSGNPATVAINGIGNSLLHRCFFYEQWIQVYKTPPAVGVFRDFVAMGFVGDDSIGGVSNEVPWFNMVNYKSWLARIGMPYTDASKSDKIVEYVPLTEASLCKRTFRVSATIVDAPIELNSIYKSMHMLHKTQEDESTIVILNVVQGLRELARWPRETFNKHQEIIVKACNDTGLAAPEFVWSYDDWRKEIETNYQPAKDDVSEIDINRELYAIFE